MFEYLMPLLVMPTYENTLLDQTCRGAVQRQIDYGRAARRAVGHLGVGLQRDRRRAQLPVPRVRRARAWASSAAWPRTSSIAPYASVLALMVAPEAGVRQPASGSPPKASPGRYGFYEAIDYTPSRLPRGQSRAVVRSFMAHHQGMGLLALAHLLLDRPMQRHFEADPRLRRRCCCCRSACRASPSFQRDHRRARRPDAQCGRRRAARRCASSPSADTPTPEVQLLSNGRYHVMVTQCRRRLQPLEGPRGHALARGRDARRLGQLLLPARRRRAASSGRRRTSRPGSARRRYEAIFSEGRAEFRRRDDGHRHAHRDRRLARGRHRAAPRAHHQPQPRAAHDRGDELRRSRARAGGRRRAAPGVQQAVRADRNPRAAGGDPVHAPRRARRRMRRRGCSS